jgi:hypothetical protein
MHCRFCVCGFLVLVCVVDQFFVCCFPGRLPCFFLSLDSVDEPRYRGPAPIHHALLNDDSTTGVSIIEVHPRRFDAGIVLSQVQEVCAGSLFLSLSSRL